MIRPRIAAVVSAAAASTAAFLVVSRWGLFGTVAGTVVFTMIHTLVSHWSTEGLDHVLAKLRRTRRGEAAAGAPRDQSPEGVEDGASSPAASPLPSPASSPVISTSEHGDAAEARKGWGRFSRTNVTQWLLAASAVVAVGFSVYAVTSPPVQQTLTTVVYRDQVIEKTVTVTTEAPESVASASLVVQADGSAATPTSTTVSSADGGAGADQSTSTAETTDTSAEETDSSSTTAAPTTEDTGADGATPPSSDRSAGTVDTTVGVPGTVTTSPSP